MRCPQSQITADSWVAYSWWSEWKAAGLLPFPGAIGDQPAYVTEAILVCENAVNGFRNEQQREYLESLKQRGAKP